MEMKRKWKWKQESRVEGKAELKKASEKKVFCSPSLFCLYILHFCRAFLLVSCFGCRAGRRRNPCMMCVYAQVNIFKLEGTKREEKEKLCKCIIILLSPVLSLSLLLSNFFPIPFLSTSPMSRGVFKLEDVEKEVQARNSKELLFLHHHVALSLPLLALS